MAMWSTNLRIALIKFDRNPILPSKGIGSIPLNQADYTWGEIKMKWGGKNEEGEVKNKMKGELEMKWGEEWDERGS